MDWTAGYASDVEYTAGFYREQGPSYLNFVSVLNGFEPPDLSKSFTYFELGFGRGLTANMLAASNPQGQFYAADFNPAHVAGAQHLAASAQLNNLTLLESSFEELAAGAVADLPQFDFITLHGIYTWVTAENRRHIVDFISRYLKPGGLVYLSYNAMPGWSVSLPLQRLIVEHADLNPNRSDAQLKAAAGFIGKLDEAQAGYFASGPALKQRLDLLKSGNPNYLVHEYMHKHWQPMYHADVARDLADAKMEFVGSAELADTYPELFLGEEKLALIKQEQDVTFRQTVKDYFFNTAFRKDVFIRGARKMQPLRHAECLSQVGLALMVPRGDATLQLKLAYSTLGAKPEVYEPVFDALARGPMTLGELGALPTLAGQPFANLAQIAALLTASGQTSVYFRTNGKPSGESAVRMNRALSGMVRFGDEQQAFASPLLGNGISTNALERMVYSALAQKISENDAPAVAEFAWRILSAQGRKIIKDDRPLESDVENLVEITLQVTRILADRLPIWRQLRLL